MNGLYHEIRLLKVRHVGCIWYSNMGSVWQDSLHALSNVCIFRVFFASYEKGRHSKFA